MPHKKPTQKRGGGESLSNLEDSHLDSKASLRGEAQAKQAQAEVSLAIHSPHRHCEARSAQAIHESKMDGYFTSFANSVDCHESAIADSRNDKSALSSLRGEAEAIHKIDCHDSLRESRNDGVSVVDCHEFATANSRNDEHIANSRNDKSTADSRNDNDFTINPNSSKLHLFRTATQGKGAVIADAFALIDADIYIMIDADLQHDTQILPQALQTFIAQSLDMLNISRKAEAGTHRRGHSLGNALFTKCVQMLFGKKFNDLFSGYRIFSKAFVKSFPATSKGFEIETELTVFALQCGLRVGELEAPYRKRLEGSFSKLHTFKDGFRILCVIFGLLFTERPLLVFGALSGLCFALGLILGVPIVVEFMQSSSVPRFPTIIAIVGLGVVSVVLGIAGLLAHLITRNAKEMRRFVYLQHSHKRAKCE